MAQWELSYRDGGSTSVEQFGQDKGAALNRAEFINMALHCKVRLWLRVNGRRRSFAELAAR